MDAITLWLLGRTPGLTRVYDSTLAADTASFDITNIPAVYNHLFLELLLRGTAAAAGVLVEATFNGDGGSNYDYDLTQLSNGTVSSVSTGTAATSLAIGRATAASATAGYASEVALIVPAYAQTTFNKVARAVSAYNGGSGSANFAEEFFSGLWKNTTAINRITIAPPSGQWAAGSRASLYTY